jgi:hypothetical protein
MENGNILMIKVAGLSVPRFRYVARKLWQSANSSSLTGTSSERM